MTDARRSAPAPERPKSPRVTAAMALLMAVGVGVVALAGLTVASPALGAAAFTLGVVAATVFGAAARLGWPWELAANFASQLAVAAVLGIAAALATGQPGLAALCGAALLWNLIRIARTPAPAPLTAAEGPAITVLWANLWGRAAAAKRLAAMAATEGADIIAFAEGPPEEVDLAALFPDHPHRLDSATAGLRIGGAPTRVAILSRLPLADGRITDDPGPGRAIIRASVSPPWGAPVRLFATHPMPAKTPRYQAERDAMIEAVRAEAEAVAHGRFVVMGDFNITPSAPAYRRLPGRRAGPAWAAPTWLARVPGLGLTIDHVLVGAGLGVREARIGPGVGSDHFPVLARIAL